MPVEKNAIRIEVLLIDGTLALFLGLALLYLQGIMTNLLFDVVAIVNVVVLSAAVFIMIAIVDLFAAAGCGFKPLRDLIFYSFVGLAFATGAVLVALCSMDIVQVLMAFVMMHGLVSGILGFVAARRPSFDRFARITFFGSASVSIAISGALAGLGGDIGDRSAIGWIGAYLCLVGIKMLFLACDFEYQTRTLPELPKIHAGRSLP